MVVWLIIGGFVFSQGSHTQIDLKLLEKSFSSLHIRFTTLNISYSIENYEGENFLAFETKNTGVSEEIGYPELPVLRKLFEVPEGAEIEFKIISLKEETINLKKLNLPRVKPRLPPVPKIRGAKQEFVMDKKAYSTDKLFPEKTFEIKESGIIRGHRVAQIYFYPARYNPVRNELKVVKELEVVINFKNPDFLKTLDVYYRKDNAVFKELLKDHLLNYPLFEREFPPLPIGLLIIVPDEWTNYITPLIKWKKEKGYYIKVAKLSQTGQDTTSIRNYIINLYNTWDKNLTFVILVGDVDRIPYFKSNESSNPINDLKYGLIEGNDYFPDVYVGRISVLNTTQLENVINKIISYEKVIWSQGENWAKRAYFMASDDAGWHWLAESTHVYCMHIVRNHGMIADSLFYYYNSGTPVGTAFNDGRSLGTYSGHGGEYQWWGPPFTITDVYNLTNTDKYSFVQSYACLTGKYDLSECFMEAWIRAPSKGAIASFGSSVTSYWYEDDILQRRVFDELFDTGYVWVMGAINEGKIEFYNHYGNTPTVHRYFQMYNLFGDPSLLLFTNVPLDLTVNHPQAIPMGNFQINVSVSDINGGVENALVCIMQNDSILDTKYTDDAGNATLSLNITSPDTVFITVTSYNHKPYRGFMLVITQGVYIIKGYSILSDSSGNNNGIINPGEIIDFSVYAKNVGSDPAYGVYGILTSNSVTILQDSSWFGNIPAGDSALGSPIYKFQVPSNSQNNQNLSFSLTFHDFQNSTWISNFSLKVYKPVISKKREYITNDGNGNGILDPNEQADLIVVIKNTGGDASSGVNAKLVSLSPLIEVIDSTSNYGAIQPGDSANNLSDPFRVFAEPTVPPGYQANFLFITQTEYDIDTFNITITVGKKHYFVWDPDPNHSSGPVIHSLLQQLGYSGDYSTTLSNFSENLYMALFVCVGIYPNNYRIIANSQEALTIVNFAQNSGGRVYLEGGDVWYYDPLVGGHNFGPLFGINPLEDGTSDLAPVQGINGTFTQGMYFATYSGENAWIDHITASGGGAFNILYDTNNNYYCGVANNAGTYKTVGTSFEIAGLNDGTPPSTRLALLDSIMHFFGIHPVSIEEGNGISLGTPRITKLIGAIPNPSFKNTEIVFQIAKKERVNLIIYDATGRISQKLIEGKVLDPGKYRIKWNTEKIPQGVYFIKLETESYRGIKKGVILR